MSISGYDLDGAAKTLGQWIAKGLREAAQQVPASPPPAMAPEKTLYNCLLIPDNNVKVHLITGDYIGGELTALEDAGLVLAYSNAEVLDRVGEAILRVIPYSSVLCIMEQLPETDDE